MLYNPCSTCYCLLLKGSQERYRKGCVSLKGSSLLITDNLSLFAAKEVAELKYQSYLILPTAVSVWVVTAFYMSVLYLNQSPRTRLQMSWGFRLCTWEAGEEFRHAHGPCQHLPLGEPHAHLNKHVAEPLLVLCGFCFFPPPYRRERKKIWWNLSHSEGFFRVLFLGGVSQVWVQIGWRLGGPCVLTCPGPLV